MTTRGWCPTLFEPMQAGDGWLLRIKPRRARLSAAEARVVADVANRYGNGIVGLTNRGNLQLRGFAETTTASATEHLLTAGLADPDPRRERRRNLLVPTLLSLDPALSPVLPALIAGLEAMLADPALDGLPGKFGVVVDGGGALPLTQERGDIRVIVIGDSAWIGVDGGERGLWCGARDGAGVCFRLAAAFLEIATHPLPPPFQGGEKKRPAPPWKGGERGGLPPRMRDIPADRVFAAAGLHADAAKPPSEHTGTPPRTVGFAFGRTTGAALAALADLAGEIRITPWHSVVLPGIGQEHDSTIATLGGLLPGDPRRLVHACPGWPACSSAHASTEADAATLLAALTPRATIHLSGCAKGCAHSGPAAITLTAQLDGNYALIRDGRAADTPATTGLGIDDAARLVRQDVA